MSSYTYGPDGARLKKTANTGPSGALQSSLYLGADLELSPHPVTGVLQWTKYLSPDAKRVGSQTFWHHRDHLKSIRIVTDASGATTKRSTFRAYGDRGVEVKAPGEGESKGYIGERADAETGLLTLNARYYDPATPNRMFAGLAHD